MSPGPFIQIECACGHRTTASPADMPAGLVSDQGYLVPEAIPRLTCSACGRKGRPKVILQGWSVGSG
jgi:hypothetical protein